MRTVKQASLWDEYIKLRQRQIRALKRLQKKALAVGSIMANDIDHLIEHITNTLPEGE